MQALSNRDFIQYNEKYIKLLFVAFVNAAGFYFVKSEPEVNQLYPDVMFLWRPPYFSKYQSIFKLKYLKKKYANLLDKKTNEAIEQMNKYLNSNELRHYIERKEGGMETVKAYVIIFVGEKAKIVEEINWQ